LNVLFIISSLRYGGAERQTVIDANHFSENHNVTVVTFYRGELENLLNKNIKFILLEKKGYINTSKRLRKILIEEKIDIVNASLFASMIISVMASCKLDMPVIWFFHSHEYDMELKSRLAFKYYSKKGCLKKILFVSEELKNHFGGYGFSSEKTDILYNNYTVRDAEENTDKESKITIGNIGRLIELKRTEYLVELAEYLINLNITNFRIVITGDGPERKKLESLAETKQVSGYISFEGFRDDVEKYYNRFDIFALPSREECLSISLIDACIKAIPSVAFDTGGNNEILLNGKTGFLVNEKQEFFEKVKKLITDSEKREKLGSSAREYCKEKFSSKVRFEKLEGIYNKLTEKN